MTTRPRKPIPNKASRLVCHPLAGSTKTTHLLRGEVNVKTEGLLLITDASP